MFDVNFETSAPQLICHPALKVHEQQILEKLNPFFLRDHFILFSSGTSGGDLKGYALSKKALFANAEAVNHHFALTKDDVWGLSLPIYHVGGLSVLARAELLKNKVIDVRKWDPINWKEMMKEVTITTVVPTQLYDLVRLKLRPSPRLRYLVVGGDFLSSALEHEAIKLGWPVIRTYGMSEVSSQLASAHAPQEEMKILPIHQVKTEDNRLLVKSSALFTLEFQLGERFKISTIKELSDKEGFYFTKDRVEIKGNTITPLGRMGDELKISGHLIDLNQLRETLSSFLLKRGFFNQMELVAMPDERTGQKLVLYSTEQAMNDISIEEISELLRPVRVQDVIAVPELSRTNLGKLKKTY
jgi:o-succinylbenzoate---CoA ligase